MPRIRSANARAEDLSRILTFADSNLDWDIHEVEFNKSELRRSPSIRCEDMTMTVYVPYILSRAPENVMESLFKGMYRTLRRESDISDVNLEVKDYLQSKQGHHDLMNIYKELGLVSGISSKEGDWNNTLRAIKNILMKGSLRKSEIRSIEFRWAGEHPLGYSAYGLPYGRIVVLDRSLGPGLSEEAVYAAYHEVCYVLAYSVEKDRLNKTNFRKLIHEYTNWSVMEQSCNAKGYRFRNSPIVSKEGDRW